MIEQIAERHQATPAQVALALAMQLGYAVIKAVQLTLSAADMAQIAELERGHRLTSPKGIAPQWD